MLDSGFHPIYSRSHCLVSLRYSTLGSGSKGNSGFVATDKVRILVDAGFSYRSLNMRLAEIGEDIEKIDAVLLSHEHSDHAKGLAMLAKKAKVPFYMTEMTAETLDWGDRNPRIETFVAGSRLSIGDLEIDTFTIPHDAVDPVGFCVRHNGFKLGLVTDLGYMTASIKHRIQSCDLLLLESNHDLEMLKVGPYPWSVKQRVMSRVGHLSNQAVGDFLASDFDRAARTIILGHLSGNNNHPEIARINAEQALTRAGAVDTRLLVAAQDGPSEVFEF